jgi:Amt family ammonium transporter
VLIWMLIERIVSGRPSLLGGASGGIAGLVAVTPAAGTCGPFGAILLAGASASVCYGFVASMKHRLRIDDTLDVFGIHGLGGIVGSLGTALVTSPHLWGYGGEGYSIADQLLIQLAAVAVAILWSAAGSALAFWIVRRTIGLRVERDQEREGLDLADHGERAYNY